MVALGAPNVVARRVIDDRVEFSGETTVSKYINFFIGQQIAEGRRFVHRMREEAQTARNVIAQLNAMIVKMEAMEDQGEVFDSLMYLKEDRRGKNNKLMALNDLITQVEEEIKSKEAHVEIMVGGSNSDAPWISMNEKYLLALITRLIMAWLPICGELRATSRSIHWEPMFILYFRRSVGEEYRVSSEINRVVVELHNVVIARAQFIEELDSLGVCLVPAKLTEFLKEIQMKDRETVAQLQILGMEMELNASYFPIVVFFILDKLTEDAKSFRLQDKMKLWFTRAHTEEESFTEEIRDFCFGLRVTMRKHRRLIAELEALGQRGDALRALNYMREIVARDSAKLEVLEQLLACTHVGIPLKAGYVADMEEKE
ncbi:hypothetical protein Tco_0218246 [Tanacetum coccineum]